MDRNYIFIKPLMAILTSVSINNITVKTTNLNGHIVKITVLN